MSSQAKRRTISKTERLPSWVAGRGSFKLNRSARSLTDVTCDTISPQLKALSLDTQQVDHALAVGSIDQATHEYLLGCLQRAKGCRADSHVHKLLSRISFPVDPGEPHSSCTEPANPNIAFPFPAAGQRPGLARVHRQLHRGAISTLDEESLATLSPLVQIQSLVRQQTQVTLSTAIRQIWSRMHSFLAAGVMLIPADRPELETPSDCDRSTWEGIRVARLPLDEHLGRLFGASTVDQALAVLRRSMERMGVLFVDHFLTTPDARRDEFLQAEEILSVLRCTGLRAILCNGFTSGTADIVNPLHCLVRRVLAERGEDPAKPEWQQAVLAEHVNFSVGLATFSLDCLGQIEHMLRQPASPDTVRFVRQWSNVHPNIKGKGCPFDCNYDDSFFTVREITHGKDSVLGVDFDADRFCDAELPGSKMLRLGCPSLGVVHREFSQAMADAYFSVALPVLLTAPRAPAHCRRASPAAGDLTTRLCDQHEGDDGIDQPDRESPVARSGEAVANSREVRYHYTPELCGILQHLGCSLLVTTYQAGKLLVLGAHQNKPRISFLDFDQPMGIAVGNGRIAVGTRRQIHFFKAEHATAPSIAPRGTYDGCFLPRTSSYTGAIHGHDIAFGSGRLWIVNTLFSCLCTLDEAYSFVPQWTPPFLSRLTDEDRCHLNGLAMQNGHPRYVTVMAETDEPDGWREHKIDGGAVIDVPSGSAVARGLSMPHSPRMRGSQLWVLNSGCGGLGKIDLDRGEYENVETMPGYTRGLCFAGQFAFVGLSKIRETAVFGGIPIAEDRESLRCGIGVVDLISGSTVAVFQFLSGIEEIFSVEVLPGLRCPFMSGSSEGEYQRDVWVVPKSLGRE